MRECPFCGSNDTDREAWATRDRCGPGCMTCGATAESDEKWNTRPADAVRVKGEKFLHAVEAYHDAIKLRGDVENSRMWSCELRVMYAAMVEFRAALAQDGRG